MTWLQLVIAVVIAVAGMVVAGVRFRQIGRRDLARAASARHLRARVMVLDSAHDARTAPGLNAADLEWLEQVLEPALVETEPAPPAPSTGWHWKVHAPTVVDEAPLQGDALVDAYRDDYAQRHQAVITELDADSRSRERLVSERRIATLRSVLDDLAPPVPCNCLHHPITGCPDLQRHAAGSENPTGNEAHIHDRA